MGGQKPGQLAAWGRIGLALLGTITLVGIIGIPKLYRAGPRTILNTFKVAFGGQISAPQQVLSRRVSTVAGPKLVASYTPLRSVATDIQEFVKDLRKAGKSIEGATIEFQTQWGVVKGVISRCTDDIVYIQEPNKSYESSYKFEQFNEMPQGITISNYAGQQNFRVFRPPLPRFEAIKQRARDPNEDPAVLLHDALQLQLNLDEIPYPRDMTLTSRITNEKAICNQIIMQNYLPALQAIQTRANKASEDSGVLLLDVLKLQEDLNKFPVIYDAAAVAAIETAKSTCVQIKGKLLKMSSCDVQAFNSVCEGWSPHKFRAVCHKQLAIAMYGDAKQKEEAAKRFTALLKSQPEAVQALFGNPSPLVAEYMADVTNRIESMLTKTDPPIEELTKIYESATQLITGLSASASAFRAFNNFSIKLERLESDVGRHIMSKAVTSDQLSAGDIAYLIARGSFLSLFPHTKLAGDVLLRLGSGAVSADVNSAKAWSNSPGLTGQEVINRMELLNRLYETVGEVSDSPGVFLKEVFGEKKYYLIVSTLLGATKLGHDSVQVAFRQHFP